MTSTLSIYVSYPLLAVVQVFGGVGQIKQVNEFPKHIFKRKHDIAYCLLSKMCQTPVDTKGNRF